MEFGVEVFGFEAWTETALLGSQGLEEGLEKSAVSSWENVVARG